MSNKDEVEVIIDDLWEEDDDPEVKQKIAEIIDSNGKLLSGPQRCNAARMLRDGGFQVAYVSHFAGHVLGNAIQPPIIRAELIQDSLLRIGGIPESILKEIAQLREDLWRIGQSYCVREDFGKKDVDR